MPMTRVVEQAERLDHSSITRPLSTRLVDKLQTRAVKNRPADGQEGRIAGVSAGAEPDAHDNRAIAPWPSRRSFGRTA